MIHLKDIKTLEPRLFNKKALEIFPLVPFYLVDCHGKVLGGDNQFYLQIFLCLKTSLRTGFDLGLPDSHSVWNEMFQYFLRVWCLIIF